MSEPAAEHTDDNQAPEPFIRIEQVSKQFGEVTAVNNLSLDISKGELFAILGGSGSGKTTLLRLLAGLEQPGSGRIIIDGVDMTDMPPYDRPLNMMFQSYAVFPHMTVEKNVGYGLRKEGLDQAEIHTRVDEMLELVRLSDFKVRKPDQLSGGQLQRVALARALVKRPKALLLDEPLAALDKRLREHTQFELMNIQDEIGVTCILVTHDQEEAMSLATRIGVMDQGEIVQTGRPSEIYEYPRNRFVAEFFGTTNTFEGVVKEIHQDKMRVETRECGLLEVVSDDSVKEGDILWVAVRPEKISLGAKPPESGVSVRGMVWDLGYYGNYSTYRIRTDQGAVIQVSAQNQQRLHTLAHDWEDEVYLTWDTKSAIVLTS